MATDETLIRQVKKLFEEKTGWGDSGQWTNQDFLRLSESILEQTGVTLSHVTLKRVWGKVKYESLPNTHTLNTLVQFLGYESWRDFAAKHAEVAEPHHPHPGSPGSYLPQPNPQSLPPGGPPYPPAQTATAGADPDPEPGKARIRKIRLVRQRLRPTLWIATPLVVVLLVLVLLHGQQPAPLSQDYSFSSKKVVTTGLPNSVIFDYDATRSPEDSVVIQQSWDTSRRTRVSKNEHQHTSVYYYPDFYHATLQVQNKVVKSHNILIETNGWLPLVEQSPVPVYFRKEETIADGKLSLPVSKILEKNIPMQPHPPTVMFANVRDFGEIYSDHFVFETSLKDDFSEGSAACQLTRVYLLCEGTAIWIPLCSPGCVSNVDLYFTYFYTSGKREDLSAFGVDFSNYVKLRVESDSGRAKILINDKPAYTISRHIIRSKIIGIMCRFEGTGSMDYVSLSNGKVNYREDF
ncbi:MAG TPA: hypothetical protein VGM30_13550 [Puia sp.]|jgi:hypothetical protein